MPFNSKSTPTSPNLHRNTHYFVQKRKILKRSAYECKSIKGSIHVFTQEGNQCGLYITPCVFLTLSFPIPRVFWANPTILSGISSPSYNFPTNNAWCLPFPIIKTKKKRFFLEKSVDTLTKPSNHMYGGRELPLKILKFEGIIFVIFFF